MIQEVVDEMDTMAKGVCPFKIPNPSHVQDSDLKCFLYHHEHGNVPIFLGNDTCTAIDPNHCYKIITHGWLQSGDTKWLLNMKNTYISCKPCHVIICDWSSKSRQGFFQARADILDVGKFKILLLIWGSKTKLLGSIFGNFFIKLVKECKVLPENIHCIGHSLGSHALSFGLKKFMKVTGKKIGRLSGLDVSGPCFDQTNTGCNKNDALMVDTYHTDSGAFGSVQQRGKVDTYANGGTKIQPNCPGIILSNVLSFNISRILQAEVCMSNKKFIKNFSYKIF